MHLSASLTGKRAIELYTEPTFTRVLEVGALDVNGTLRDHNEKNLEWVGVDCEAGKGVDVVVTDPYKYPFDGDSFDMVMASSVFEHSEFFWLLFMEMVRVTKLGGVIYVSAPSNGTVHRYPVDVYRFYPDAANALVNFAKREGVDVGLEETFILRGVDGDWSDWVAVFRKGKISKTKRERIAESFDICYFEDFSVRDSRPHFTVPDQDLIVGLRARLATAEAEIAELTAGLATSEAEKVAILSSRGWKLLSPARTLVGALRKFRAASSGKSSVSPDSGPHQGLSS